MRFAGAILVLAASSAASEYTESVEKWRQERETLLKSPDNWLSVAGLFWLKPGENTVGSDPSARITLPKKAPARAGVFTLIGDAAAFRPTSGKTITIKANSEDFVTVGGVKLSVIHRGERYGIRVRDNDSEYRKKFTRLEWFPIDPSWRVHAKYIPLAKPRTTFFDSQTGDKQEMIIPGVVEFKREGKTFRLSPVLQGEELFFVLRDTTAGKTTYPAARFLYVDMPKQAGPLELDFNKMYNPPCVFTPYATCPLPPKENRLPIAVEAGEKMYRGTAH